MSKEAERIELPGGYFIEVRNNGETCAIVKPDGDWLNGVFNIKKAQDFSAAMNAQAKEVERLRIELGETWHGLFLDGRNEHGSHVLPLPSRSIMDELEEDDLHWQAEDILKASEKAGYKVGQAVVGLFRHAAVEDGGKGYWEFVSISDALTDAFYGSSSKQDEDCAALNNGGQG